MPNLNEYDIALMPLPVL